MKTDNSGLVAGWYDTLQVNPDWAKLPIFDRSGWENVRFGDVVECVNETCDPASAGIQRFIGMEHLEPGSLHVREWGNVSDGTTFTRRCRPGQVLFGKRRAYQRKVAVAEFDAVVSGDIYVFMPKDDRLLPELLPFICMSERFFQFAVETSAGSLSPRTNWSHLAQFEFALPPLDQQRRMAEILWAVDQVACAFRQLSMDLQQGLSVERDHFFSANAKVRTLRVEDLFEVQLGKMLSPKARKGKSPTPYLGNKNVQWGSLDLSEVLEMDFSAQELMKFRLKTGDLLVCEGGEVGRSTIWDGSIPVCCFQKALHRLRPLDGRISPEYMLEFMFWAHSRGRFSALTGHSTIAHLTAIKLKSLDVPVVDQVEQQRFLARLGRIRHALRSVAEHRSDVDTVGSQLLNALLGGAA